VLGAAVLTAAAPAHAAAPKVDQLVVYKNGDARQKLEVSSAKTTTQIGSKRCAVGSATPLAALLRSGLDGLRLRDYGSCSRREVDAGGLYVRRIGSDVAKGVNGWVYKVGHKVGTTGAGDPSGPFGHGRLKPDAHVTWFYCHMGAKGCQRTLGIKLQTLGGQVHVTVSAYDDQGHARRAAGATVFYGTTSAKANESGELTFAADPGPVNVHAERKGMVRSFREQIVVK
jgi:hypothetical protein